MSVVLIIGSIGLALMFAVLRALFVDETRGRIQRHAINSVEATIASLPLDLQEEWADEWRAELDAKVMMPLTALLFAQGLRRTARQLLNAPITVPVGATRAPRRSDTKMRSRRWASSRRRGARRTSASVLRLISRMINARPFTLLRVSV